MLERNVRHRSVCEASYTQRRSMLEVLSNCLSVGDVVGFKRDPDWTAYACETAAAFAKAFLLTRPIEPISKL